MVLLLLLLLLLMLMLMMHAIDKYEKKLGRAFSSKDESNGRECDQLT
jgi:hypothetical protein